MAATVTIVPIPMERVSQHSLIERLGIPYEATTPIRAKAAFVNSSDFLADVLAACPLVGTARVIPTFDEITGEFTAWAATSDHLYIEDRHVVGVSLAVSEDEDPLPTCWVDVLITSRYQPSSPVLLRGGGTLHSSTYENKPGTSTPLSVPYVSGGNAFPSETNLKVSALEPFSSMIFEAVQATAYPETESAGWTGCVNSDAFKLSSGGYSFPPFTLISRCHYELINRNQASGRARSGDRWRFHYELEYNPDGWPPVAVFRFLTTHKIPTDATQGNGILRFDGTSLDHGGFAWYRAVAFSTKFAQADGLI